MPTAQYLAFDVRLGEGEKKLDFKTQIIIMKYKIKAFLQFYSSQRQYCTGKNCIGLLLAVLHRLYCASDIGFIPSID